MNGFVKIEHVEQILQCTCCVAYEYWTKGKIILETEW